MAQEMAFALQLDPAEHEARVLSWRRARVSRLTAPDSWLSLIARDFLHEGDNVLGSDPHANVVLPADRAAPRVGVLRVHGVSATFVPEPGVPLWLQRSSEPTMFSLDGPVELATDAHGRPDRVVLGTLSFELMERAGELAVRVRDTQSPARVSFPGIDYYPIQYGYRVIAQLEPYDEPKIIELAYENGRVEPYQCPGAAVFTLNGETHRVDPVIDTDGSRLFILFSDPTNRDTTYGAGRFLYAPLPHDNSVLLDWNQAFNPPCAFTPYAFCPLTPPQNRLSVRIEAGEKRPLG